MRLLQALDLLLQRGVLGLQVLDRSFQPRDDALQRRGLLRRFGDLLLRGLEVVLRGLQVGSGLLGRCLLGAQVGQVLVSPDYSPTPRATSLRVV